MSVTTLRQVQRYSADLYVETGSTKGTGRSGVRRGTEWLVRRWAPSLQGPSTGRGAGGECGSSLAVWGEGQNTGLVSTGLT